MADTLFPGATPTDSDPGAVYVSPTGARYRVTSNVALEAELAGYRPLTEGEIAGAADTQRIMTEQEGLGASLVAGTEAGLSALTFGATDYLLKKAVGLAGVTEEEYLAGRREREIGNPLATTIGEATGVLLPALATLGGSAALQGGARGAVGLARLTPVGLAMQAGRGATTALEAGATRLLGTAATSTLGRAAQFAATTVAPRALGGALEGALWGTGEGVRETVLGKAENVGEAIAAHIGSDALLFGALGGGLGVIEAGLPGALSAARKAADSAYERLPFFGRRSLLEAAVAAPEQTGVAADTARLLYAERAQAAALETRLRGAVDELARSSPESVRLVLDNVDSLGELGANRSVLAAIAAAPVEQAELVLGNVPGVRELLAQSKTALGDSLAASTDQLRAVLANAPAVATLERQVPGALRQLLAAPPELSAPAMANAAAVAELERASKGALERLLAAPAERATVALANAPAVVELERVARGSLSSLLEAPAELADAALRNAGAVAELERSARGTLRSLLTTDVESAAAILENAPGAVALERVRRGSLRQLLDAEPARARAIAADGVAVAELERSSRGSLERLLTEATPEEAEFFSRNARAIADLERDVPGAAGVLRGSTPEQAEWFLSRADELAAMEAELPGSMPSFRAFVVGENAAWSRSEADALLDNWRKILRNPNERARIATEFSELKAAQYNAGEKLSGELYKIAQQDRAEMLRAIGQPGGPPSLEGIAERLTATTTRAQELTAKAVGDALTYDARLAEELASTTNLLTTEFVENAGKTLADPVLAAERLEKIRSELGETIGALKRKPDLLGREKRVLGVMKQLYGDMTATMHDAAVWGEAAAMRAQIDDAFKFWKQKTGPKTALRKEFMQNIVVDGEAQWQIAPRKVNVWINQVGDVRNEAKVIAGQSRTAAFHDLSTALQKLIDTATTALPSVANGAVDVGANELRALVQKAASSTAELEQRALYSRIYNQIRLNMESGLPNTLGFRHGSVNLGGYPHGVPTAGTSGFSVVDPAALSRARAAARAAEREAADRAVAAIEARTGERAAAAEAESLAAADRLAEQRARVAELERRSREIAAPRRAAEGGAEADALSALPPGAAGYVKSTAERVADLVPAGVGRNVLAGYELLRDLPQWQWQVASRVRGMAAVEARARQLAEAIDAGAKRVFKVAKLAGRPAAAAERRSERPVELERKRGESGPARRERERRAAVETMQRVQQLANDPQSFADLAGEQGGALALQLPEVTAAVTGRMQAAVDALASVVPAQPAGQLDAWQPSNAEIARFQRVQRALAAPVSLLDRVADGTLTREEVEKAESVFPSVVAQMRVAVLEQVNDRQAGDKLLPRQTVQAVETLLGFPLSTDSTPAFAARAQEVFGGARQGKTEKADGGLRPLAAAGKVSLGNRYETSLQSAWNRGTA